ncbi:MAG: RNA-protein complex protein Nop10 [Candidatus Methanomethylophilaceae archaeon]|nr:RNA-protein complex protein Nop10 [Candidatus Methanomethylophilaceae archaeon]
MKTALKKCKNCSVYTLNDNCPQCGRSTVSPIPPRYSPDDRYGEYRRRSIIEEYGENGKYNKIQ